MSDRTPSMYALAEAAADNDTLAEERGVVGAVQDLGMSMADLRYVAGQRALRAVLVQNGRIDDLARYNREKHPKAIQTSAEERRQIAALIPTYIDGMTIGARWAQRRSAAFGIGRDTLRP